VASSTAALAPEPGDVEATQEARAVGREDVFDEAYPRSPATASARVRPPHVPTLPHPGARLAGSSAVEPGAATPFRLRGGGA
jgi:hypothetical protein